MEEIAHPDHSVLSGRACAKVRSHVNKAHGENIRSLVSRVSMKLEEGGFKGAVRLACSDNTIADCSDETFTALQSKHLPPHQHSSIPSLQENTSTISASENRIIHAVQSFPCDSAGGPNSLRPQHLKDMLSFLLMASGSFTFPDSICPPCL